MLQFKDRPLALLFSDSRIALLKQPYMFLEMLKDTCEQRENCGTTCISRTHFIAKPYTYFRKLYVVYITCGKGCKGGVGTAFARSTFNAAVESIDKPDGR